MLPPTNMASSGRVRLPQCKLYCDLDPNAFDHRLAHPAYGASFAALLVSTKSCWTCGLLQSIILHFLGLPNLNSWKVDFPHFDYSAAGRFRISFNRAEGFLLRLELLSADSTGTKIHESLDLNITCFDKAFKCFLESGPCGDTGSFFSLDWARQKLTTCSTQHMACKDPTAQLPTRVLDIMGPLGPCLVTNASFAAPYACLSHCGGQHQHLQTNSQTLEHFKQLIPWSWLPKTFMEAITVARFLGTRYLWTDSLSVIYMSRINLAHYFLQLH